LNGWRSLLLGHRSFHRWRAVVAALVTYLIMRKRRGVEALTAAAAVAAAPVDAVADTPTDIPTDITPPES